MRKTEQTSNLKVIILSVLCKSYSQCQYRAVKLGLDYFYKAQKEAKLNYCVTSQDSHYLWGVKKKKE